jgi:hypothetical protein
LRIELVFSPQQLLLPDGIGGDPILPQGGSGIGTVEIYVVLQYSRPCCAPTSIVERASKGMHGALSTRDRRPTMPLLRPDPTFYPSPKMAMQAPPEKLAYLALINPKRTGAPDAIGVVDLDPGSKSYGRLIGQTEMPQSGDELHHFGWNA